MAPCEMQNNGMLVFVFNGGGVAEIVNSKHQKFFSLKELSSKLQKVTAKKDVRRDCHLLMQKQQVKFTNSFYNIFEKLISSMLPEVK